MIKNYLTVTFRNFVRNKNYTFINILGLTIGIACCITIFLLIRSDLAFNSFHSKKDNMFMVVHHAENASGIDYSGETPYPFAKAFRNDFSDIPLITQFHHQGEALITAGTEKLLLKDVLFADSMFFEVFDFKVLSGNPQKELGQPGKVFLTEAAAEKLMKDKGTTTLKLDNILNVEVAGIIANPPANSDIKFSMVVSMPSLTEAFIGFDPNQWGLNSAGYSYVVLPQSVTKTSVEQRFKNFVKKYYPAEEALRQTYLLHPLSKIHFDSRYNDNSVDSSDLIMLGVLGTFILTIACINFINLATALAVKKSREIGIRKTLGAQRAQLTYYFLGETFLLTAFSVLISLGLIEWILPWLNVFLDKKISLTLFGNPTLLIFLISLTLVVTVLSGVYPGLVLSRYNPVDVLKNKLSSRNTSGVTLRKVLVSFQFLIAQTLIIGTLIVADQMDYFRNKPLGFDKEAIINIEMPDHKPELFESFRTRLLANADIRDVSFSIGAPVSTSGIGTNFNLADQYKDSRYDVTIKDADHNYLKTYGLTLIAGRWMTENEEKQSGPPLDWKDRKYVFVVNESAVKTLGFNNPQDILDKNITIGLNDVTAPVIGVVKDFHTTSMHKSIIPVVLLNFHHFYNDAGVKVNSRDIPKTLSFIESTWNALHPDYYFKYEFLDQHVAKLYRQEERTFTLFKIFSIISIFIGCLGLFGLVSFMTNQKLKEVGIRKVMGASVYNIVILFSREFVRLIVIAFAIAAPLSWYFMNDWLHGFAYRVEIQWYVFLIGVVITLLIALLTVGYQSVKAALTNPVDTLRSE